MDSPFACLLRVRPAAPAAAALMLVATALTGCHRLEAPLGDDPVAAQAAAQEAPAPAPAPATDAAQPPRAEVGQKAPGFKLSDTAGKEHALSDYTKAGKLVVLEWFNPDCPIARNYHLPTDDMAALASAYAGKDVVWLAINSGAPGKQGAGLDRNRKAVEEFKLSYPVLLDESGEVGQAYSAKTTPHMYVIDKEGLLRYAGAIDDGDPSQKGKLNYVRQALDEILAGKPVTTATSKPFGCSVKYAR